MLVGCDSFIGNTGARDLLAGEKWVQYSDELLIAFAGNPHPALLVTQSRHLAPRKREPDEAYLARVLESVRKVHKDREADGTECELLLAYRGRCYSAVGYSVVRSARGFACIGSGADAATAALVALALTKSKLPPVERLRVALSTAAAVTPTVSEPFRMATVPA